MYASIYIHTNIYLTRACSRHESALVTKPLPLLTDARLLRTRIVEMQEKERDSNAHELAAARASEESAIEREREREREAARQAAEEEERRVARVKEAEARASEMLLQAR